jgi:hypothetical protein
VTQISIAGFHGILRTVLYTRDTIDFSQILTTGTAPEEDVIVGGNATLLTSKGTIRALSTPEDASASKVRLTNLVGQVCP